MRFPADQITPLMDEHYSKPGRYYNGPSYEMKPNHHDAIREARRELWLFAINVALVTTAIIFGLIWLTYSIL